MVILYTKRFPLSRGFEKNFRGTKKSPITIIDRPLGGFAKNKYLPYLILGGHSQRGVLHSIHSQFVRNLGKLALLIKINCNASPFAVL